MAAKRLRAVGVDEKPERVKHTVASAAAEGDQLDLLIAMRDRVAKAISAEECPPRDLGTLTKRLDDIVEKIEKLKAAEPAGAAGREGDANDESFDAAAV